MQALARVLLCVAALQLLCVLPGQVYAAPSQPQAHQEAITMPELPLTENGRKYHACLIDLGQMVGTSNTSSTAAERAVIAPLYGQSVMQVVERTVEQLPDTFADNFCTEVHAMYGMQASLDDMVRKTGAGAAAARPAFGRAGQKPSSPDLLGKPSSSGNQVAQASTPGSPVQASGFNDWQTDPTSKLTLPHKAVYYDGRDTRTDDTSNYNALVSCTAIKIGTLVTETLCAAAGAAAGTWQGEFAGAWESPAESACLVPLTALQAGYTTCAELLAFNDFYDSTVNNAELKATYENVIKTMDNQVNLWKKVHYTHVLLSQQISRFESDMNDDFTVLTTQSCDLKTRLADLQREANYLRYLLTTPVDKRPSFSRSAGRCSFADPSYCSAPAQTPAQALSLLKTQLQEACSVTDGVRDLDLTTESQSAGL